MQLLVSPGNRNKYCKFDRKSPVLRGIKIHKVEKAIQASSSVAYRCHTTDRDLNSKYKFNGRPTYGRHFPGIELTKMFHWQCFHQEINQKPRIEGLGA